MSPKSLESLLVVLREHGVLEYRSGDVHVVLSPTRVEQPMITGMPSYAGGLPSVNVTERKRVLRK